MITNPDFTRRTYKGRGMSRKLTRYTYEAIETLLRLSYNDATIEIENIYLDPARRIVNVTFLQPGLNTPEGNEPQELEPPKEAREKLERIIANVG